MRESEYARGFTWESTGYKGDAASLALLSAEIQFYDFVLNDPKVKELGEKLNDTPLSKVEKLKCEVLISFISVYLNQYLPMFGLKENSNSLTETISHIKEVRNILNIKLVD